MRATLEFDVDDIDQDKRFLRAVKADNAFSALEEISRIVFSWSESARRSVPIKEIEREFSEIFVRNHIDIGETRIP
jgi:hypothetical protein